MPELFWPDHRYPLQTDQENVKSDGEASRSPCKTNTFAMTQNHQQIKQLDILVTKLISFRLLIDVGGYTHGL